MEEDLLELFMQIQELAGIGIEALGAPAEGGEEAPVEGEEEAPPEEEFPPA